jgi:6-pyruvoyltetrahydropterin/6-carboxytetrahydropterin synthase
MQINTVVEFDAAHRLTFHPGKCRNLHGHRWKVEIMIGKHPYRDIVADFGDIKSFIRGLYDHKVLVFEQDEVLIKACKGGGFEMAILPYETTAENIAQGIKELLALTYFKPELMDPKDLIALTVTVYETPENSAKC